MDHVPSRLEVLVAAVSLGLACDAHARVPVQLDLVAGEELVDLLEGEVLRLGTVGVSWTSRSDTCGFNVLEEVDERQEQGVEDGEVGVRVVADVFDADGCDLGADGQHYDD